MKRIVIAMILCAGAAAAQQAGGVLNWSPNGSNITVNGPTSAGTAFTYALPGRSGTLALTSDLTPTAPVVSIANGTITLTNGSGSATVPATVVRCVVSDPSGNSVKYARAGTTLSVSGVGPTVDFICV
jgi:hypothetical protein